jgi:muramidase (phage lysozyme)
LPYGPLRACIRHHESRGHYQARRRDGGSASGAYGVIDATWSRYRGYVHAWQAPPRVQDEWAVQELRAHGLAAYDFGPGTTGALCRHLL